MPEARDFALANRAFLTRPARRPPPALAAADYACTPSSGSF